MGTLTLQHTPGNPHVYVMVEGRAKHLVALDMMCLDMTKTVEGGVEIALLGLPVTMLLKTDKPEELLAWLHKRMPACKSDCVEF